ncbi:OmpA family protein [Micromonospora avicenniae]|uniref:Outer membrane protein OmpA n=1 Tax=Micromonospora avicenniae TaxID=1198245 RepID=A0A1N6VP34_9ACTN|nr:OmpA family protein [Micromonospora avicenniae]SIQ79567.1 Outer membrane protein OmpA [Micromonospora avicenniae]
MTKTPLPSHGRRINPIVALIVAILGLAVLVTAQQLPNRHRMETDLTERSTVALRAAGLSDVRVTFTGRDGRLTAGSAAEADRALDVVQALEGVRTVESEAPAAAREPVPVPPTVVVALGHDTASLRGTVPTVGSRTALVDAATAVSGAADDDLSVDPRVGDAALAGLPDVLRAFGRDADRARVELGGGTLSLTGAVPSELHRNAVRTAARHTGAVVVDRIEVPDVQRQLNELPRLTFASGGDSLSADTRTSLVTVARILKVNPSARVRIEGHTDSTGSADSNLALSRARARTVQDFLVGHGVTADRLSAEGYGETRLEVPDVTGSGRAQNRRVELLATVTSPPTDNDT